MPYRRKWDETCPVEYKRWEADGAVWTVEDLHPEDDELAVQLYVTDYIPDEFMCSSLELYNDAPSVRVMKECWSKLISLRTSLGCYREVYGKKELVGVNCLVVKRVDEPALFDQKYADVKAFKLFQMLLYMESSRYLFEELGVEEFLSGLGLLVTRPYRGLGVAEKLLAAREPLCKTLGLTATVTVFIGTAAQTSATKAGFSTLTLVTFGKLAADAGLTEFYPTHQSRTAKLMYRKYKF